MSACVSPFVPAQFPGTYQREYPLFVQFVKYYYEYLEQHNYPVDVICRIEGIRDASKNPENLDMLISELFYGLPGTTLADKANLLYHSKEFFASKGTEDSLRFVFRILFGREIEIIYPGDDLLIASFGNWFQGNFVALRGNPDVNSTSLEWGGESYTIKDIWYEGGDYNVMSVTNSLVTLTGFVNTGYPETPLVIFGGGSEGEVEIDITSLTSEIETGTYSKIGLNVVIYPQDDPYTFEVLGIEDGTEYTLLSTDAGFYDLDRTYEKLIIRTSDAIGFLVKNVILVKNESAQVVLEENVSIPSGETVSITSGSETSSFETYSASEEKGVYLNRKHLISEYARIQDGRYYSPFSYAIKIDSLVPIEGIMRPLKELVHPVGMAGFIEVDPNIASIQSFPNVYPTSSTGYSFEIYSFQLPEGMTSLHVKGENVTPDTTTFVHVFCEVPSGDTGFLLLLDGEDHELPLPGGTTNITISVDTQSVAAIGYTEVKDLVICDTRMKDYPSSIPVL